MQRLIVDIDIVGQGRGILLCNTVNLISLLACTYNPAAAGAAAAWSMRNHNAREMNASSPR